MIKRLNELEKGTSGIIKNILLDEPTKLRLFNFGVYKGEKITYIYSSCFLDPKAYLVKGTSFALRDSDAKNIEVEEL